jgi:hypothetical protein
LVQVTFFEVAASAAIEFASYDEEEQGEQPAEDKRGGVESWCEGWQGGIGESPDRKGYRCCAREIDVRYPRIW